MKEFKFEIGELVNHICDSYHGMIVIERSFVESTAGIHEKYTVSSHEMGQIIRQSILVEELCKAEKKINP